MERSNLAAALVRLQAAKTAAQATKKRASRHKRPFYVENLTASVFEVTN